MKKALITGITGQDGSLKMHPRYEIKFLKEIILEEIKIIISKNIG